MNPRLGVRAIRADADLRPGQAHRLGPQRMQRHRHQRHAHLLAGRKQHVHLAGIRPIGDLLGQIDQMIGLMPHGADDHHHLIALLLRANGLARSGQNLLAIRHAGAAEFLNNDGHDPARRALIASRYCYSKKCPINRQPSSNASDDLPAAISS